MYKLCIAHGSVCWVCPSVLLLAWKGRKEKEQVRQLLAGALRTDTISQSPSLRQVHSVAVMAAQKPDDFTDVCEHRLKTRS